MNIFWLAVNNLQRRVFRTLTLALAVAVAAGAVFSTSTVMWGVERSLTVGLSKFGADLLVVPKNALVNMKSALLTGEPSTFYMPGEIMPQVAAVGGVAKAAPQLFLTTADGNHCIVGNAFLVGFDPANDFTVLPWLTRKQDRPHAKNDAIVGGNSNYDVGDVLYFYGEYFMVYGKLDRTGIGLYDNAIFITMNMAYDLAEASQKYTDGAALGFKRGEVSALLVQVGDTAKANLVRFALAKNPEIKIITAGNVVTSVRQNVVALFAGTVALAVVLVVGNVLMISAIFSSIVNERRKELGLLRAIGARRVNVFSLVVSEAMLLTALGGAMGVFIGTFLLRVFARTIGFHLELLNIPFLWPSLGEIGGLSGITLLMSLLVGTVGAAYPALVGSRMEPYDAIRSGE